MQGDDNDPQGDDGNPGLVAVSSIGGRMVSGALGGNVRVISDFRTGDSYEVDATGERVAVEDALPSSCGVQFDEYVRRANLREPFPYSSMGPARRAVDDLWPGRKLRLLMAQGGIWRQGEIVKWCQWCPGPFSPCTWWDVTIRLDEVVNTSDDPSTLYQRGDLVEIQGLKNANKHNGKKATIKRWVEDKGRFMVCYGPRNENKLGVKPKNLQPVLEIQREVCRVNIHGGGTLGAPGQANDADRLSFEWIDSADPEIDLSSGINTCPQCRAIEPAGPTTQSAQEDSECPICLKTTSCFQLHCDHFVCQPCWQTWCRRLAGEEVLFVEHEELNEEELASRRVAALAEYEEVSPTHHSPPDCQSGGMEIQTARRINFNELAKRFAEELVEDANAGAQGHIRLRKKLMEQHLLMWNNAVVTPILLDGCSIPALEIIVEVLHTRLTTGCFHEMERWKYEQEGLPPWETKEEYDSISEDERVDETFAKWTETFYHQIGRLYEKVKNYYAAIPWYEKGVELARRMPVNERAGNVSEYLCCLGACHQHVGDLSTALNFYNKSIETDPTNNGCPKYRERLLREMRFWTGTSQKMTPERNE